MAGGQHDWVSWKDRRHNQPLLPCPRQRGEGIEREVVTSRTLDADDRAAHLRIASRSAVGADVKAR